MRHAHISVRITLGLLAIAISVLMLAFLLGMFPGDLHLAAGLSDNRTRLLLFYAAALFATFYCFIVRSLNQWDPTRAVPERVKSALNTLTEGVVVLDEFESMVLVNTSFATIQGKAPEDLIGLPASTLPWIILSDSGSTSLPWIESLRSGSPRHDARIGLRTAEPEPRIFRVNSTPLRDEHGALAGAMATFVDVTAMERSRQALCNILREMSDSREDIKRQNQELQVLATFDPLTNCLNRRAFFERLETHWKNADRYNVPLSCMMIDLDHFKTVNDTFGHHAGDEVLKAIGQELLRTSRDCDLVCRYGGEEFCVVMPHTTLEQAEGAARRVHQAIAGCEFERFRVTASIGVAERAGCTNDPHDLLNEADRCLYLAKNGGRNRIVVTKDVQNLLSETSASQLGTAAFDFGTSASIPFHAVTALYAALSFRDATTAEHSRRVADLCVVVGEGLLSHRELYVLEVAALLHDIGKIGVPDAILLKPGKLAPEEREIISNNSRMGVEILHSAFSCQQLTEIVRMHTLWYAGQIDAEELPGGEQIPVAARLLRIVDAYDSMTTARVYRPARTREEAFAELRRFAGTQFDPALVEHFIGIMSRQVSVKPIELGGVSPQTALNIGVEIQRLAELIDSQDIGGVRSIAGRLKAIAEKQGIHEIARCSAALETVAYESTELTVILSNVRELLDLCRSTQHAFLDAARITALAERDLAVCP